MMISAAAIKERLSQKGAVISGIAPAERFAKAPRGFHPQDILPECKSIVVFGLQFPSGVTKAHTNAPYTLVRNYLVAQTDQISVELMNELEREGLTAIPIPCAEPYEFWDAAARHGRGILSLKHAAVLAGLGVMGKNTLLINETYGNMLWLGAILLSAALEPDPLYEETICPEGCHVCLDVCPAKAMDGVTISQKLCRAKMCRESEGGGFIYDCNRCRIACPHFRGKRNAAAVS